MMASRSTAVYRNIGTREARLIKACKTSMPEEWNILYEFYKNLDADSQKEMNDEIWAYMRKNIDGNVPQIVAAFPEIEDDVQEMYSIYQNTAHVDHEDNKVDQSFPHLTAVLQQMKSNRRKRACTYFCNSAKTGRPLIRNKTKLWLLGCFGCRSCSLPSFLASWGSRLASTSSSYYASGLATVCLARRTKSCEDDLDIAGVGCLRAQVVDLRFRFNTALGWPEVECSSLGQGTYQIK